MPKKTKVVTAGDEYLQGTEVPQVIVTPQASITVASNNLTVAPAPASRKKVVVFIAAKAFELNGETYAEGDEFALPAGFKRDAAFDDQRGLTGKRGITAPGLSFAYEGPVLDKKTGERNTFRVTLPVREA